MQIDNDFNWRQELLQNFNWRQVFLHFRMVTITWKNVKIQDLHLVKYHISLSAINIMLCIFLKFKWYIVYRTL